MYVQQKQFGQYVARDPHRGATTVSKSASKATTMKGFGQATDAPVYYPEPVLSTAGQLVVLGVSFGVLVLASFIGTRWAMKRYTK